MKKLFFLSIITVAILSLVLLKNPIAQEETPSPALPEEPKTEEIQLKDDSRIQEIKETIRQKVEEKLDQAISEQKKVGWLGIIKMIDSSTITLESSEGNERQVLFSDETIVVTQKSQKLKIEDLTEGKKIVALGFQESESIADAKRIILVSEDSESNKLPLLGTISDKSQVEDLIVVTPLRNKDQALEITVSTKAQIVDQEGKELNYDSLKKGQKVALVYQVDEEENTALLIKILSAPETEAEEKEKDENLTDD